MTKLLNNCTNFLPSVAG